MATNYVNTTPGELVVVAPSFNGGTTYTAPALINTTRGITFTVATNTDEVVDSNNPSNAAVVVRSIKSQDSKLDGAGLLDSNSVAQYMTWAATGASYPTKLTITTANSVQNSITVSGNYILESFTVTAERAKKSMVSLTLVQAGPITVTAS